MGSVGGGLKRGLALGVGLILALTLAWSSSAHALEVPPAPADIPVVDQTGTLTDAQKQSLAGKIAQERQATGNQVGVLVVGSLQGEAIEDYSIKVARQWGIGQKGRDNGVLLLVAKDDHRVRIEVGYGLEGVLPDVQAGHIIQDRITPQFKQGNYYQGISAGLDGIIAAIHGQKGSDVQPAAPPAGGAGIWFAVQSLWWLFLLLPVWLSSILARSKSWWLGGVIGALCGMLVGIVAGSLLWGIAAIVILTAGGLLFDKAVSGNYRQAAAGGRHRPSWWAGGPWIGGGGGFGGSGGFGGFSGGSFGGGGASGSW